MCVRLAIRGAVFAVAAEGVCERAPHARGIALSLRGIALIYGTFRLWHGRKVHFCITRKSSAGLGAGKGYLSQGNTGTKVVPSITRCQRHSEWSALLLLVVGFANP